MSDNHKVGFRVKWRRFVYFFPFRLLMLHLKKNHFLLFFWVLLIGFTINVFASRYGVVYQFLYPEYRGTSTFVSFAMVGFALGGFILAFNLYTYILHGFRFPFIATLQRPFYKFSLNNFIIPLVYVIVYLYATIKFQLEKELLGGWEVAQNCAGFIAGMFIFLIVSQLYFFYTNRSVHHFTAEVSDEEDLIEEMASDENPVKTTIHNKNRWSQKDLHSRSWRVLTYLSTPFKINLARQSQHYHSDVLNKVFSQNHINASIFEIVLVVSFILIGTFRENSFFVIPAAASALLFFTILLMVVSALFSWVKGWTLTFFIFIFVMINYSFESLPFMNIENHAYGLDYSGEKAEYSAERIESLNTNDSLLKADESSTIEILNNWKSRNTHSENGVRRKPKLVIVNTSGGGLRSALWTMNSLLHADSALNGKLLERTQFITGASGGMVGAAYLRELYYRKQLGAGIDLYDPRYIENISKDLLNPILFSIATNDFFIRYQSFEYDGHSYTKDRAHAFEKQLHQNTDYVLDKQLGEYAVPEKEGLIPMMVLSPTIINDGRRLLISSQQVSYLTRNQADQSVHSSAIPEDVEFSELVGDDEANDLRFSSALRMNATFPYILPSVSLPTDPTVSVMDAGLRDNFGTKTTLQYIYTFREWINENTSGVVILQVRDTQKTFGLIERKQSLIDKFTAPLGSIYGNVTRMQEYNNDQLIRYISAWFEQDVDVVTFQLDEEIEDQKDTHISLSWHLTEIERKRILDGIRSDQNQKELERLVELLN
ncbi:hypothetical protein [Halocola ammonii]